MGKTYAMLMAARTNGYGTEVLLGWVEAETTETEKLAAYEMFSRVKPRAISYQGGLAYEMDTEEIIKRHPGLVLIDNLEHVNAPGALKPKRYFDVAAILSQGIDVYTTLNIQHVESLTDIVTQIIGWKINETVPDTFLENADQIQLVDVQTDELIRRFDHTFHDESKRESCTGFFESGISMHCVK